MTFFPATAPSRSTPARFLWPLLTLGLLWGCAAEDPGSTDPGSKDPGSTPASSELVETGKTNLLLITVDTLRADRLGCYGHADAVTPNMDRLAEQGARLTQALTHVPMTLPAHAGLMTGRLPIHTGVRNNGTYVLPESEITLAELLKADGYSTAAALGSFVLLEKFGLAQGFDVYNDQLAETEILRAFNTEIRADRVLDKWRDWKGSKDLSSGSGFFYWAHFYDPHLPYDPPEPFRSQVADPYDGEVAFVDRQIGEMIADLESSGLLDSTLVVITSDHGEAFGEHGEYGHGLTAYRPALHVPLILRGPGIAASQVIDARVGLVDLLPTLMDLLDIESPAQGSPALDGRSFAPWFQGRFEEGPREVYFETLLGLEDRNWAPLTGLYSGDRKLISLPKPELYDVRLDPDESRNLISEERRVYRALDEKLQELMLGAAGTDSRRELTDEDRQKLESLGYVSGGSRAQKMLDPKDGLKIDAQLRDIESRLVSGDLDRASRELSQLRQTYSDQDLPSFYLFEHRIAVRQGRSTEAIAALESGIEALPEIYPLRYELARYLIDQGRSQQAEAVSRALVGQQPDLSQGWILLGRSLEPKDPDAASRAYDRALELDPGNSPLVERMAELKLHHGDLQGAVGLFDRLIRDGFYDQNPEGLFKTAMLHMRLGSTQESEQLFALGLSQDPQPFFQMSYAMVLDRNGKRQEAITAMQQAIESGLPTEQQQLAQSTLDRWSRSP